MTDHWLYMMLKTLQVFLLFAAMWVGGFLVAETLYPNGQAIWLRSQPHD